MKGTKFAPQTPWLCYICHRDIVEAHDHARTCPCYKPPRRYSA